MATVNKDFRIKAGLVVEGANATVNGEDIITTGSTTDDLQEGSTNKYFTNQRAIDAVSSEITNEVTTAINALDTDDIEEGATNQYYTEARAKADAAELLTGATLTNISITGDGNGLTITAENGVADSDTDDLAEGVTNLYFTNQRALDATASAYDAAGSASSAQAAAEDYADGVALTAENNAKSYADSLAPNYDPAGSATTAENNAKAYADSLASNYDAAGAATTAENNAKAYTDAEVAALVDGAPALLDTLNELAAAIADNPNYATDVANLVAGKQNILTAGNGITIADDTVSVKLNSTGGIVNNVDGLSIQVGDGLYTSPMTGALNIGTGTGITLEDNGAKIAVNTDTIATKTYVDNAISTGVGAITTDDVTEGNNLYFTDERAIDAVSGADIYPNAVIVNNLAKQVAATAAVASASTVSALTWAKADYKSAKLLVKAKTASHSQVSEIIVTLDASDNVAITEFGIVYTDGELATVSADVSGSDVRVRVTTVNASTDVYVVGTLLA